MLAGSSLPPISICIAARNEELTIWHAVQSILGQAYDAPFEVLIGVSASTDTTEQIVRSMERKDSRIRLVLSPPGKAATWNALFAAARHDTLVFMDADVVCEKDCLRSIVECLSQQNIIAVAGNNVKQVQSGFGYSLRKALHYPFEDRVNIGISGRLYALKRNRFRAAMYARSFYSMPEDLICDDLWIMLILEKRNRETTGNVQWSFCRDAIVYFQPAALREEFKRAVRNYQGYLQIEREYPKLGFTISQKALTVHAEEQPASGFLNTLKSKLKMIGGLDSAAEKILLALILIPRKILLSKLYHRAYAEAVRTYDQRTPVWEVMKSSKREWALGHGATSPVVAPASGTRQ